MLLTANAAVSWSTPTHPTRIGGEVVDPVRHRAAELLDQEVMDTDFFRVALGAIFASVVAKIADQFLFLGVDGDHRLLFGQRRGPGAASDPWRSFSCAQLPVAEFARTPRPPPIPSAPTVLGAT